VFGGIFFGQTYFGGSGGISGVKHLFRATMRLLNGLRTIQQVR
jgi:hypothetical protein